MQTLFLFNCSLKQLAQYANQPESLIYINFAEASCLIGQSSIYIYMYIFEIAIKVS